MHPMEYKKEKVGTGRFSHMILKNSRILVGIDFDRDEEFQRLLSDPDFETYLLYPGEEALNLRKTEVPGKGDLVDFRFCAR